MQSDVGPRIQTTNICPRNEANARLFTVVQNTLGAVALWLEHRTINHQENLRSNRIGAVSKLGQLSFSPCCHISVRCRNEYLLTDSGRYLQYTCQS